MDFAHEGFIVLENAHASTTNGHYGGDLTACKVLQVKLWWNTLFKDAHARVENCDIC